VPAGFNSDDEYVSEDDEKERNISLPARKFQGVQPPPNSQEFSKQSSGKDVSHSSYHTAFTWTRNTCALRAPGTDPMKLREKFTTDNESRNLNSLDTGKELGTRNSAAADKNSSDGDVPFGIPVPRRVPANTQRDTANWAWVEEVLKTKDGESTAPRGSLEVSMQTGGMLD